LTPLTPEAETAIDYRADLSINRFSTKI